MTAYVKDAGVWKPSNAIHVKDAGVWKPVQQGYVKDAGVWKPFGKEDAIETDFSEYAVGQQPSDWNERWATSGDWAVQEDAGAHYLRFEETSDAADRRALTWGKVGERTDGQVLYQFKGLFSNTSNEQSDARICARLSGTVGNESGYVSGYRWGVEQDRIQLYNNGGFVNEISNAVSRPLNVLHFCRFEIDGSNLRMNIWRSDEAEPDGWMYSVVNSDIPGPGEFGFFCFGFREVRFHYFAFSPEVGTRIPLPL